MRVFRYIKFNKVFGVDVTADKAGWCTALFAQFAAYLANTKMFLWDWNDGRAFYPALSLTFYFTLTSLSAFPLFYGPHRLYISFLFPIYPVQWPFLVVPHFSIFIFRSLLHHHSLFYNMLFFPHDSFTYTHQIYRNKWLFSGDSKTLMITAMRERKKESCLKHLKNKWRINFFIVSSITFVHPLLSRYCLIFIKLLSLICFRNANESAESSLQF